MNTFYNFTGATSAHYANYTTPFGQNFTIEAWINPSTISQPGWATIIARGNSGTANAITIYGNYLGYRSGGSGYGVALIPVNATNFPINTWTHIALSVSGTTSNFYKNGELISSPNVPLSTSTESTINIGDWSPSYGSQFRGGIHDIRLWDYAKTQNEIKATMYQYVPRTSTGLKLNFRLNKVDDLFNDDSKLTWINKNSLQVKDFELYTKVIIKQGNNLKKYNGVEWVTITDTIDTFEKFISNTTEHKYLNPGPEFKLNLLDKPYRFIYFSANSNRNDIALSGEKQPQLLISKIPFNISGYQAIKKFYLTTSGDTNNLMRIAISIDNANTWLTYNNGSWEHLDLNDISLNGISSTQLNNMGVTQLTYLTNYKSLLFAFYIPNTSVILNDFRVNIDNKGTWNMCIPGVDYNYLFSNSDTLTVNLFSNGDFKVIFPPTI